MGHQTVINDDPDIVFVHPPGLSRDMYLTALSQEGYSSVTFDSVDPARRWLESERHRPKVVVLELLPTPDEAWMLIDVLRQNDPGLAVIILTSSVRPDRAHRRRAQAARVSAFVGKPCGLRQFVDVVVRVLQGERGIEEVDYAVR